MADVIAEMLHKYAGSILGGKGVGEGAEIHRLPADIEKLSTYKLDKYYAYWRDLLISHADRKTIPSNGWAFATMSGISMFENHVKTSRYRQLYVTRTEEVSSIIEAIRDSVGRRSIGGFMLYGYGNLAREASFVSQAKGVGLLSRQRVHLIDCSIFYDLIARSALNPLRDTVRPSRIGVHMKDLFEEPVDSGFFANIRSDLNPTKPVIHLLLGNAVCNVEAASIRSLLQASTRPGDLIVIEYANYTPAALKDMESNKEDYAAAMARAAISEIFSVSKDRVQASNVLLTENALATEIEFDIPAPKVRAVKFRSMLRRRFSQDDLLRGRYELVCSEQSLGGELTLDLFRRGADDN